MKIEDLFDSENLESVERMIDFERVLAGMGERDQRIVALYAYGYTQVEIGVIVGLSQRHVVAGRNRTNCRSLDQQHGI